jgi:hypothetical protein
MGSQLSLILPKESEIELKKTVLKIDSIEDKVSRIGDGSIDEKKIIDEVRYMFTKHRKEMNDEFDTMKRENDELRVQLYALRRLTNANFKSKMCRHGHSCGYRYTTCKFAHLSHELPTKDEIASRYASMQHQVNAQLLPPPPPPPQHQETPRVIDDKVNQLLHSVREDYTRQITSASRPRTPDVYGQSPVPEYIPLEHEDRPRIDYSDV